MTLTTKLVSTFLVGGVSGLLKPIVSKKNSIFVIEDIALVSGEFATSGDKPAETDSDDSQQRFRYIQLDSSQGLWLVLKYYNPYKTTAARAVQNIRLVTTHIHAEDISQHQLPPRTEMVRLCTASPSIIHRTADCFEYTKFTRTEKTKIVPLDHYFEADGQHYYLVKEFLDLADPKQEPLNDVLLQPLSNHLSIKVPPGYKSCFHHKLIIGQEEYMFLARRSTDG